MNSLEPYVRWNAFEGRQGRGRDANRGLKSDVLGNRSGGGSAAERAVFEMGVPSHIVVRMMRRHGGLNSRRTDLQ
jgi:hypothetical protein